MTNAHSPAHDTTGPVAVPSGGHWPAGWTSPEAAENAERNRVRVQIAAEVEAADRDDLEAEVDRRLAAARRLEPAVRPEPVVKSEAAKS